MKVFQDGPGGANARKYKRNRRIFIGCVGCILALFLLWGAVEVWNYMDYQQEETARQQHEVREANPDVVACRARDGFPIYSGWSGAMIDCKPLPEKRR